MHDPIKNEQRTIKRRPASIAIIIKGRESTDVYWKEVTEVINVSRLGANFHIQRKCPAGRILSLLIKMPKNLRCYDLDKKLYRVWALVQHCTAMSYKGADGYQIGVAFVGKDAPKSYIENPLKTYRVSGMDEDGFWNIDEAKTPFVSRAHHRFLSSEKVRIAIIDSEGEETEIDTDAITKDISIGGTAVFSMLEVDTGDCVRFTCDKFDFSSVCLVRNRQRLEGGTTMLHLSFSESTFPIAELNVSAENTNEHDESEELEFANENDDLEELEFTNENDESEEPEITNEGEQLNED